MKRINLIAALMLAVSFGPAAAAGDRVVGESLDSGLGELAPTYTAAEFMPVIVAARSVEKR